MKRLPKKNIILTPSSETTEAISYEDHENILEVQFTGGRIYRYFDVPTSIWQEYKNVIVAGGSSGTFVNTRIKPKFRYKEVRS